MYLNELEPGADPSLGVSIVRLVTESKKRALNQAKKLIVKTQQDIGDQITQRKILELIETIVIYKFPEKSRQELEVMLGLGDLKDTRFYQEAEQEGERKAKIESVPRLLQMGLILEQIAQGLNLPIEVVRQAAQAR
jgi:predicted transposase/invertase (TIGR01784 family)